MNFFKNTSIGLDIADNSIKAVKIQKNGQKISVKSISCINLAEGIVSNGKIIDEEKLSENLKKLFNGAKPNQIESEEIIFGLPESQVYIHLFSLPEQDKKDREDLILKEAQISVPVEASDLLYSYEIIKKTKNNKTTDSNNDNKNNVEVLLVAASLMVVLQWQRFFQSNSIEVESFDIETLASFRSLYKRAPNNPVCIIDLGARKSTVSIFDKDGLRSTYSTFIAGNNITDQISSAQKISLEEAEKNKLEVDLDKIEDETTKIVLSTLEPLIREVRESLEGFNSLNEIGVKEVILIGGLSQMRGLLNYLSKSFKLPVKIGVSAWLDQKVPLVYIESVGLALRGLQKKWDGIDPEIPIPDVEEIRKQKEKNAKKKEKKTTPNIKENPEFHLTNERVKNNKLKKQKIALLVILIIGIILIGLLYWYQTISRNQRSLEYESQVVSYSQIQTFGLKVPISVDPDQYTPDRVRGRIIIDTVSTSGSYNEALQVSQRKVKKQILENETLWEIPLDEIDDEEEVEFPIEFRWLVYNDKESNELFLNEVKKINTKNIEFELNNIVKTGIVESNNEDIFFLNGDIALSLDELIEIKEEKVDLVEDDIDIDIDSDSDILYNIVILDTPIGSLNVRLGAGTSNPIVAEVFPGDEFGVLEEVGDWVKVKVNKELKGWVIKKYVKKK